VADEHPETGRGPTEPAPTVHPTDRATDDMGPGGRTPLLVALEPRWLRRSLLLIFVAIIMFQVVMW